MKKLILFLTFVLTCSLIYSQQWAGSTTTSGLITREGNVVIGGTGLSGSWAPNSRVLELQSISGEMSFLAFREGGSNSTSFDIGFKSNNYAALYSNQVPMLFVTNGGERMRINTNGSVGIGTGATNLGSFKLAVEGKIGAREIKVTLDNPWPDYVFNKEYPLLDIASLHKFISINKHLPGIPSAEKIKESGGIELGQMTLKLVEKIEELTLYVIQLKKENDEIKLKIKELAAH